MKKEKKNGESKEHKKNWKEYMATVEDIQNFIMDRILLRHNVITGRVEYREPDGGLWQPISDRVVNSLWAEMSQNKEVRAHDIYRVLESDFVPEFHPFRFYLEHLPPWNGDDHILAMSVSVNAQPDRAATSSCNATRRKSRRDCRCWHLTTASPSETTVTDDTMTAHFTKPSRTARLYVRTRLFRILPSFCHLSHSIANSR